MECQCYSIVPNDCHGYRSQTRSHNICLWVRWCHKFSDVWWTDVFLLSSRNDALPESMHIFVKRILHYILALILPVSLALMSYILPLKGEMCSAMVSAAEGEDLASLQAKAFSAFRSACRKPTKPSCKWSFVHFIITSYLRLGNIFPFYHISGRKILEL